MPLRVVVLAGGRSSEHDVSMASAQAVTEGLAESGHDVHPVTIERNGTWRFQGEPISLFPGGGLLDADVVFPVLHGPFGEDGTVQGALEVLDVAYVGSGVAASALCMDKVMFKELMRVKGVPQVDYTGIREELWRTDREEVLADLASLGLPVFVKPAHLGSSVGIVKVSERERLGEALDGAFAHDALVIVESMASGVEVECAVLGLPRAQSSRARPPAIASEPGQISFQGEWYDFQAKYAPGGMELVIPAPTSSAARERVRELAIEVFTTTGCDGLARVDFFLDDEQVLVNELNTMPGFTPTSVYAKLIDAAGISYPQLVDRLCLLALERHAARRAYSY